MIGNDPHLLREFARAGQGLALLPDVDLDPFGLPVDALVPVLTDEIGGHAVLGLSMPAALADSPKISAFVEMARRFLARARLGDASAADGHD